MWAYIQQFHKYYTMKLKELLEKSDVDIKTISGRSSANFIKNINVQTMGSGIQGTAYKHPNIPNTVIKTAEIYNPNNDGYMSFVKLALKHQDNPFFPKIYKAVLRELNIKLSSPYQAKYELVVQMERLHKLDSDELVDITPQLFQQLGLEIDPDTFDLGDLFGYLDSRAIRQDLVNSTNNPKFRQAMKLLEVFMQKWQQDLHAGNWMIRLTSVGPQLVIIDPFSFRDIGFGYKSDRGAQQ